MPQRLPLCLRSVNLTGTHKQMNRSKLLLTTVIGSALALVAQAQQSTPVETVTGAAATSTTAWTAFAGLSAAAFVFAMIVRFSRKGTK